MNDNENYEKLKPVVDSVAYNLSRRYKGVANRHDAASEMWLWVAAMGFQRVTDALDADEGAIRRMLFNAGRRYADRERAHMGGYEPQDQLHYTVDKLLELIPIAQDETWDGLDAPDRDPQMPRSTHPANEGGNLLAQVMDVRRAAAKVGWDVNRLLAELGGERPVVGRRRMLSNIAAQARTSQQWNGGEA